VKNPAVSNNYTIELKVGYLPLLPHKLLRGINLRIGAFSIEVYSSGVVESNAKQ